MDPVSIAVGAGVAAVVFYTVGWFKGRRRPRKQAKAVCGCKHHYSFHDPKTGKCMKAINGYWNDQHRRIETTCSCVKYYGPIPIDDFIIPEIGG